LLITEKLTGPSVKENWISVPSGIKTETCINEVKDISVDFGGVLVCAGHCRADRI